MQTNTFTVEALVKELCAERLHEAEQARLTRLATRPAADDGTERAAGRGLAVLTAVRQQFASLPRRSGYSRRLRRWIMLQLTSH